MSMHREKHGNRLLNALVWPVELTDDQLTELSEVSKWWFLLVLFLQN